MSKFRLKVQLDPQPDDREALARWPRATLDPDLATVASGWIALEFDGRALGQTEAAVEGDPLNSEGARIGDYVFVFLQHLIDAATAVKAGGVHEAGFGDSPACLVLEKVDGAVKVAYRDDPAEADVAAALPTEGEFLFAVKKAASRYLEELQTLNPALLQHPDVASLRDALRGL